MNSKESTDQKPINYDKKFVVFVLNMAEAFRNGETIDNVDDHILEDFMETTSQVLFMRNRTLH